MTVDAALPDDHNLPRSARLVLAAAFFFALGFMGISELVKVLYLVRLGFGPQQLGLLIAVGAVGYSVAAIPSGLLGSRFGQRRIMLIGASVLVLGLGLMPAASIAPEAIKMTLPLVAQVAITVGWALINVNLIPLLMAATNAANRNHAFSLNAALRGAGTLTGMLFGGMLPGLYAGMIGASLDHPAPYAWALVTSAVLAAVGLGPLLRYQADRADPPAASGEAAPARPATDQDAARFPWLPFGILLLHVFTGNGGWAFCQAFFNAYADAELLLSASQLGLLSALGQVLAVAMIFLNPRLARRFGNLWILLATQIGQVLAMALIFAAPHWAAAGLGRWGILVLSAMWLPVLQVVQMELVPERFRSLSYGFVSATLAGSYASASVLGGALAASRGSYRPLFGVGAALCVVASCIALLMMRRAARTRA